MIGFKALNMAGLFIDYCTWCDKRRNKKEVKFSEISISKEERERIRKACKILGIVLYDDEIDRLVNTVIVDKEITTSELINMDDDELLRLTVPHMMTAVNDSMIINEFNKLTTVEAMERMTREIVRLYKDRVENYKIIDSYTKEFDDKIRELYKKKGIELYEGEAMVAWELYSDKAFDASFLLYEKYMDNELYEITINYMVQAIVEFKMDYRIKINKFFRD